MYRIISGGYFVRHPQTFSLERPSGFEHYVFLHIRSEAILSIANHIYTVAPNSYLFIRPRTPYSYSNPNGPYINDWIHFECDAEDLGQIPPQFFHQPLVCNNPSIIGTYIEQLVWEKNFAPEEFRMEHTHQLFQIILRHVLYDYNTNNNYHPYRIQMQKQRMSMQATPYLYHQADSMANELGISRSYYEHLYKSFFGQSFRSDLIDMRIAYAKDFIKNTTHSFEQIAQECGYNSEVHFYRQFLAKTGTTPGEYRKSTNSQK